MYETAEGTLIAADNSYGFRIAQITVFSPQSINKGKSTFDPSFMAVFSHMVLSLYRLCACVNVKEIYC